MKSVFLGFAIIGMGLLVGCEEDKKPIDEARRASLLLAKVWETSYVAIEGTDVTDLGYSLMQVEFLNNGTWKSVNSNGLFAPTGTWKFVTSGSTSDLTRLDFSGKEISITLNEEGSSLVMRFERVGSEIVGGRASQSGGDYEIFLLPKFAP
jgi:hypothetical protein